MGLGKRAADQRLFIDQLDASGAAALVVELGQNLVEIPRALTRQAELRGLPLIALHREIPFVEVTESIHGTILGGQAAALRRGEEVHRRLSDLVLEGAGIPEILDALAQTIANPVVLERAGEGVAYHASHRSGDSEVLGAWDASVSGSGSGSQHRPPSADAPTATEMIAVPVPGAGGDSWGRLIALPLESPLDEFARVALERAGALIALTPLRSHQEHMLYARARGNFLADIAPDRIDGGEARRRAEALGFRLRDGGLLLPLAIVSGASVNTLEPSPSDSAWSPVWAALLGEMRSRAISALVGVRAQQRDALALLVLSGQDRRGELVSLAATAIRSGAQRHVGGGRALAIAAGRAVPGWTELPAALREAADTAAVARSGPPRHWHDAAVPDIERLLLGLGENAELRRFVQQRLEPLIEHDRKHAAKLLPTVEAFIDHQGRKSDAARALNMERQSLYHRIARIEAVIGARLDDPETVLGLQLALRVRRLHGGYDA